MKPSQQAPQGNENYEYRAFIIISLFSILLTALSFADASLHSIFTSSRFLLGIRAIEVSSILLGILMALGAISNFTHHFQFMAKPRWAILVGSWSAAYLAIIFLF